MGFLGFDEACRASVIALSISGGISGEGTGEVARFRVGSLPSAMQDKVCKAFDPNLLAELEALEPTMTDGFVYHVEVGGDTFYVSEDCLPAETIDLFRTLSARFPNSQGLLRLGLQHDD